MISSFDEKLMNNYDDSLFMKGILAAYNFNYYEGLKNDDLGIDHYCNVEGDMVFVASSVVSPGLVE